MPRIDQETERAQGRATRGQVNMGQGRALSRTGKSRRGFAAMSPELQRQIARKGGEASARVQRRDAFGQFSGGRSKGGKAGASRGSRATARARAR